jgi:hypothetical protein
MSPLPEATREERLKALALAKGWIGAATFAEVGTVEELANQGQLTSGQVEALRLELDRPDAGARTAGGRTGEGANTFKATWVETWGHFEDLSLLAEGGMGRIFKALDRRLQRRVALKLLHRDDPELASRFLHEASLQAQVEHPHVCRIYEAGEWMGQAFIAMQLIEGETLKLAARRMTLLEKLDVMIQVCEGVHAAHQQGLIHRDLKPSNLMVKQVEGTWRAFVLDFGLARTLAATGKTQSGVVMGTVHYMSPEQARGEERGLDRRTDIYALGATLYELFGGEPPFSKYQGLEALGRILAEDPVPLRRKAPQVPRDLETVVMKCLERNREQRYGNARELAGELRKVVEGEPVEARRASWPERGFRWARKNRLGMAAGASLFLMLAFGGLMLLREQLEARRQGMVAAQMTNAADRMEFRLQLMRLRGGSPRGWREFMDELRDLERHVAAEGETAQSARYARGRVLMALGLEEVGGYEVEQAWQAGVRGRAVSWSLGEALAARLRVLRDYSARLPAEDAAKAWIQAEEAALRPRAAAFLREGLGQGPHPMGYQEALLAALEGHEAEALRRVRATFESQPWLADAKLLEGELLFASAQREQDPAMAQAQLEAALEAYRGASRVAVDDVRPLVREHRAQRWGARVAKDPGLARDRVAAGERALDRAVAMAPEAGPVLLERGWRALDHGDCEAAERLGEKMLVEQPGWREAAVLTGLACLAKAERGGEDPTAPLMRAELLARKLIQPGELSPFGPYLLEDALSRRALLQMARERAPWPTLEAALREIRSAQAQDPRSTFHAEFEGRLLVAKAGNELDRGQDPRASATAAAGALSKVLAVAPRNLKAYADLAQAYLIQGRFESESGLEAEAHLAEARRTAFRAQELDPDNPAPCLLQGEAALVVAAISREQGRDAAPWLAEARRWAMRLHQLAPHRSEGPLLEAQASLMDAQGNPATLARDAQALAKASGAEADFRSQVVLARLALAQGHWSEALASAREAVRLAPEVGECRWVEALALRGLAGTLPPSTRRADLEAQVLAVREEALRLNPRLKRRGLG